MPRYIDAILAKAQFTGNFQDSYSPEEAKAMIDEVPTAEVEPVVHGNWIPGFVKEHACTMCSVCKEIVHLDAVFYPFCPYCGAKMASIFEHKKGEENNVQTENR